MPGRLRNEDYVAFLDESGDSDFQIVAGVLIPARWLRPAERRWKDFIRDKLGSNSGRTEVKARELARGEGAAFHAQRVLANRGLNFSARAAGRHFYREALEHIATITEVRVLAVGLRTPQALHVYRLWFWLMYAALVEKPRAPRPRLPMAVIDGEDASFRQAQDLVAWRFYRQFPHCQPYVGRGQQWFVGGALHQDSQLHPFIQMADLVAWAARSSISQNRQFHDWYQLYLVDHAAAMRPIGRDIDISRDARRQLRRRSRHDACGSGWPDALFAD